MSLQIPNDKIWISELNQDPTVRGGFDRDRTVRFYDTTLRDGEQAIGVVFNPDEKFEIACKLSELGVGRIESGFPKVSAEDTEAVKRILGAGLASEIWGFARCVISDIDAHIELGTQQVLVEISTSDLKMQAYGFDRKKVLERLTNAVRHARDNGIRVNFFAVDATRSDMGFLKDVYSTAIETGAEEISVVDTIGACAPEAVEALIGDIATHVGPDIPIHWHGHNDFGLATASAIAAVRGGATWIQGTVNGMGERAGNADICEVALALQCLYDVPVELDLTKAREASRVVKKAGGYQVDGWKPVVGENLYIRESGAVASQFHIPQAIEPYSADIVAAERGIVLGKKSGLASIQLKAEELNLSIPEERYPIILAAIKSRATSEQRLVSDEEFRQIVSQSQ
ncbi:MAG: homoaconitate hydratase [Candidatus Thiodiazotropha sp. (ex Troendleina suluensis)]|nr:homoaconitate hydratase [Candidatus Thiodiazotropha sp. (ex Troendleina suluensis)]